MSERRLVILGAGGHGKVCAEIAAATGRFGSIAFSDDHIHRTTRVLDWRVEFHDEDLDARALPGIECIVGVGQTGLGADRERIYEWLVRHGLAATTLISPSAHVSSSSSIGAGTVIGNMALVQASAVVGENCIVNSQALVEHDCRVGRHVHLSTGSILNGGSSVGDRCLIGSGAVVNHGVEICADTVVGSGAVVVARIELPGVYAGVPAARLRDAN